MNLLNEKLLKAFDSLNKRSTKKNDINLTFNPIPKGPFKTIQRFPKNIIYSQTLPNEMRKQKSYKKVQVFVKQHSIQAETQQMKIELKEYTPTNKKTEINVNDGQQELMLRQKQIQQQTRKKNINEEIDDLKKLEKQLLLTYTGKNNNNQEEKQIEKVFEERRQQIYRKIYENVKSLQGMDQQQKEKQQIEEDLMKFIKEQQYSTKNQPKLQQQLFEAQLQVEKLQQISRPSTAKRLNSSSSNDQVNSKLNLKFPKTIQNQNECNSMQKLSPRMSVGGSNQTSQQNILINQSSQQTQMFQLPKKKIDRELLHVLLTRWKTIKQRRLPKRRNLKLDDEQIYELKRQKRIKLCEKLLAWLQKMTRCKISLKDMYEYKLPTQPFQIDGSFIFLRYVKYNHIVEIQNLIKFDRNLLFEFNHLGQTCLHIAAQRSNYQLLQILLLYGADYEVFDFMQRTPLWYAVEAQDQQSFKTLLKVGAKPWGIQTSNVWFAEILQQAKKIHTLISISPYRVRQEILEHELQFIL